MEKIHHPARAGDNARESGVTDGPAPLDADAPGKPAKEEGDEYRAYIASELVNRCGNDVRQAVAYLIDRRWNRADALEWLTRGRQAGSR